MARRKRVQAANHERWLVSYADFITLLFAFFVVMFANSQVDRERVARVAESVKGAMEQGSLRIVMNGFLGRSSQVKPTEKGLANAPGEVAGKSAQQAADLLPSLESLSKQFAGEIAEGKMLVTLTQRGLVVSMNEAAFFPPAEDTINPSTYSMVEKLAATVKSLPNQVRMEGHTDATPIRSARFRSNWELSAARAIALMELMTSRFGVPREKVAIAGYADTAPVAPNDTAEGRSRNRRVDIVILNRDGMKAEPVAVSSKPSAAD